LDLGCCTETIRNWLKQADLDAGRRSDGFLYASDFQHEGHTAELCRGEIHELLVRETSAMLTSRRCWRNAERFYPLAR
jgi:hypothetical protein